MSKVDGIRSVNYSRESAFTDLFGHRVLLVKIIDQHHGSQRLLPVHPCQTVVDDQVELLVALREVEGFAPAD